MKTSFSEIPYLIIKYLAVSFVSIFEILKYQMILTIAIPFKRFGV